MNNPSILIYGAGGHARVVTDLLRALGHERPAFVDTQAGAPIHGIEVIAEAHAPAGVPYVIAIGDNARRRELAQALGGEPAAAVIHPRACVSPWATIGPGSVVMAGAVVQADAVIGRHCIVNTGASVDHDCRLADYVHIAPGAVLCGDVAVGEGSLVGAGAVVRPGVRIGRRCLVGAGSTVVADLPDDTVAMGTPCRPCNR